MNWSDKNPSTLRWSQLSIEMKGFIVYYASMLALAVLFATELLAASWLTTAEVAGVILGATLLVAIARRLTKAWRRPKPPASQIFEALGVLLIGGALALALSVHVPVTEPGVPPAAFAFLGFLIFSALNALNLAYFSERGFLEDCNGGAAAMDAPVEPPWKSVVGFAASLFSILAILTLFAFMYADGIAIREGAKTPGTVQTEAFNHKGRTLYITPSQRQWRDRLQWAAAVTMPAAALLGLFLRYVLGIRVSGRPRR